MEKEATELEVLRRLDAKVRRPANVFAYAFDTVSVIIMGTGMYLVMTDIGAMVGIDAATVPGIVIGILGMIMSLVNCPICKGILDTCKNKYRTGILALSDRIMND